MAPPKGGYAPTLDKFLDSLKNRPVEASVESLISLLKRRQITGSESCALATAHILRQLVARDKWLNVEQLLERVQSVGRKLVAASPREMTIGNIVRRILGLIRDEAEEDRNEAGISTPDAHNSPTRSPLKIDSPPARTARPTFPTALSTLTRTQSMFNILADPDLVPPNWMNGTPLASSGASTPLQNLSTNTSALRSEVLDGIEEIMDEIKQVDDQLCGYSDIIIHPGDFILVHQPSRTIQRFLVRSKRKFTLFVVTDPATQSESGDQYASLRKSLAANGSVLINVMNSGLMAYMARVNKVILSARAVTAKGGVTVDAGAAAIARAARTQGRTVIVLGGVYKLSPDSQANQSIATEWGDPSKYVNFSDGQLVGHVDVKNAVSEFIPAEDIDTYITNLGAHSREHLHTIINDHYKEADIALDLYGKIRK
ncbi:initiation factor 2 subunit family protein [Truncatella angustata]|uniref:Translation initiation factor eIF2B subunit beta n=1 Tax=Truncatella angustata TaxID=152316 RepID=A0A9P8UMN6_9PEZI|nr:initiation factor 2 subunit family protein [Truncatella angustata]KAH6655484.1 initiation factor 2 subunit family protein [Truncatella angustata]